MQQTTTTLTAQPVVVANKDAVVTDLSTIEEHTPLEDDISVYEPNANYELGVDVDLNNDASEVLMGSVKRQNAHLSVPQPLTKKQGVSGESCDTARQSASDISIQKYEKDFR